MFKKGLFSLTIIFCVGFSTQFVDISIKEHTDKVRVDTFDNTIINSNININSISDNEYISLNSSNDISFDLINNEIQSSSFNLVENNLNSVALWTGVSIGSVVLIGAIAFGIYWFINKKKNDYTKYGYYGDDGLFYYYDGYYGDDGMFYYYDGYYGDDGMFYYYDGYYGDDGLFYYYDNNVYGIEEYVGEVDLSKDFYNQDSYYDNYQTTFDAPIKNENATPVANEDVVAKTNLDDTFVPKRLSSTSNQSKRLKDLRKSNPSRLYTNDKDEEMSKLTPTESSSINNKSNDDSATNKSAKQENSSISKSTSTKKKKSPSAEKEIIVKDEVKTTIPKTKNSTTEEQVIEDIFQESEIKEENKVVKTKPKATTTSSNKNSKSKNTTKNKNNSKIDSSKKASVKGKNNLETDSSKKASSKVKGKSKTESNLSKSDEPILNESNNQEDDYF